MELLKFKSRKSFEELQDLIIEMAEKEKVKSSVCDEEFVRQQFKLLIDAALSLRSDIDCLYWARRYEQDYLKPTYCYGVESVEVTRQKEYLKNDMGSILKALIIISGQYNYDLLDCLCEVSKDLKKDKKDE